MTQFSTEYSSVELAFCPAARSVASLLRGPGDFVMFSRRLPFSWSQSPTRNEHGKDGHNAANQKKGNVNNDDEHAVSSRPFCASHLYLSFHHDVRVPTTSTSRKETKRRFCKSFTLLHPSPLLSSENFRSQQESEGKGTKIYLRRSPWPRKRKQQFPTAAATANTTRKQESKAERPRGPNCQLPRPLTKSSPA